MEKIQSVVFYASTFFFLLAGSYPKSGIHLERARERERERERRERALTKTKTKEKKNDRRVGLTHFKFQSGEEWSTRSVRLTWFVLKGKTDFSFCVCVCVFSYTPQR